MKIYQKSTCLQKLNNNNQNLVIEHTLLSPQKRYKRYKNLKLTISIGLNEISNNFLNAISSGTMQVP